MFGLVHLVLHIVVPAVIAACWYRKLFLKAWLIMLATLVIDLDHLLASPVYDPNRCSIGFHPLHQYPLIVLYGILAIVPKTRLIGIGLTIHMVLDGLDCIWMANES